MPSLLDSFIPKLRPETLRAGKPYGGVAYHYTSLGNISSILLPRDTMCLWASRHDCLNDISEGTLPEKRFIQVCNALRKSGEISEDFYKLIRDVPPNQTDLIIPTINGKARPFRGKFSTYITSFSEDSDALAMWNYYSKGNQYEGMNIGVSSQTLLQSLESKLNPMRTLKLSMVKVIYRETEQFEILRRAILDMYRNYSPGHESSVRYCIGTLLAKLRPVFKLDYFSHEKEVRLVVQVFEKFKDNVPVYYRNNVGFVVPYIQLNIDRAAVVEMTLGPSLGNDNQKEHQRAVVQDMLTTHGYQASVKCSDIPIRY